MVRSILNLLQFIKKYRLYFLGFCISLLIASNQYFLLQYGKWLSPENEILKSDIIVSQNAAVGRLATSLNLLKSEKADMLITVAMSRKLLREVMLEEHIDEKIISKIYFGGCYSPTSFDDALNTLHALEKLGLKNRKIVVISEKYCLRRMKMIFQHVLGPSFDVKTAATVHPSLAMQKVLSNDYWWHDDSITDGVIIESQKIIFYWINYILLGRKTSWDIPVNEASELFTNWRAKDEKYLKKTYEGIKNYCDEV